MAVTQHGYLLLADISSYTSFVAGTELEHAQDILSELLEAIITKFNLLIQGEVPFLPNAIKKVFCRFIVRTQLLARWKMDRVGDLIEHAG